MSRRWRSNLLLKLGNELASILQYYTIRIYNVKWILVKLRRVDLLLHCPPLRHASFWSTPAISATGNDQHTTISVNEMAHSH